MPHMPAMQDHLFVPFPRHQQGLLLLLAHLHLL